MGRRGGLWSDKGGEIVAEFQEVMKQRNRMCKKYWTSRSCHGCPIAEEVQAYEGCSLIDFDPKRYEELVLQWAAEHPEPVYPTWAEYLTSIGVYPKGWEIYQTPLKSGIPADIAQKLGLEPKE